MCSHSTAIHQYLHAVGLMEGEGGHCTWQSMSSSIWVKVQRSAENEARLRARKKMLLQTDGTNLGSLIPCLTWTPWAMTFSLRQTQLALCLLFKLCMGANYRQERGILNPNYCIKHNVKSNNHIYVTISTTPNMNSQKPGEPLEKKLKRRFLHPLAIRRNRQTYLLRHCPLLHFLQEEPWQSS